MYPPIRTPDQRLRVFVSSTLGELAPERAAVRSAIERLRLTPVMFELGARPHPPRELYRAYLEQSDVFVGIYWQRYGWIAPDETISGLEDEYRLAADHPRLLYLKAPAPERDERLAALVAGFQSGERVSYKHFGTPGELATLVGDDLAVLLSERFEASVPTGGAVGRPVSARAEPPFPLNATLGRDAEVRSVVGALRGGDRLVTLTGPGGIGKSRIALEAARELQEDFADGVHFVPLANVGDADGALHALIGRLGARTESGAPPDTLAAHLRDRRALLLLDNLEQIEGIGPVVLDVLERTPGPQVLATSRRPLAVRGERVAVVAPLPVPAAGAVAGLGDQVAVRLFAERARDADPAFVLDEAALPDVAEIVRRLDGLPLAIELAAARTRVLSPRSLRERLASSFDVLAATATDLPARQRTLRATLDWSYDLLDDADQRLFASLAVFAGGWTLEGAEAVGGDDVLDGLVSLLGKSLVVADRDELGHDPRFRMLQTVHAYALARLQDAGDADEFRRRHLAWYRELAVKAQPHLCGPGQQEWVARMEPERANLHRAVSTALELADHDAVVEMAWDVVVLYSVLDAVSEPDAWLRAVAGAHPDLDVVTDAKLRSLLALTRAHYGDYDGVHDALLGPLEVFRARHMEFETAVVLHQLGFVRYRLDDDVAGAVAALEESAATFEAIDHDWGVALASAMLGSLYAATGELERAEQSQRRSLEHARRIDSDQQTVQALGHLALVRLLQERIDDAFELISDSVPILERNRFRTDAANALDLLAVVLHDRDAAHAAGTARCVAAAERARLGVEPWPTVQPFIDRAQRWVRRSLDERTFVDLERRAAERDLFQTLADTLEAARR